MEERLLEMCKRYGFMIYDEKCEGHRRPDARAMEALAEAYQAGEQSRLELLEQR